jgi:hypothetical protein
LLSTVLESSNIASGRKDLIKNKTAELSIFAVASISLFPRIMSQYPPSKQNRLLKKTDLVHFITHTNDNSRLKQAYFSEGFQLSAVIYGFKIETNTVIPYKPIDWVLTTVDSMLVSCFPFSCVLTVIYQNIDRHRRRSVQRQYTLLQWLLLLLIP